MSLPEAVRILGTPDTTVRRMIREGKIEAAQFPRNPDNPADKRSVYRVLLPAADAPSESVQPPAPATEPPAATTALTAALETVSSLVERNAALSDRIAALEREAGQMEGRATAAETRAADLAITVERERTRADQAEAELRQISTRRWWWPW